MASVSLDPIVERLISVLENEASALIGVSDEIKEMKLLLISMRSFLMDAADRELAAEKNKRQKAWVASVRGLAYEVEDAIDEFTYHVNRRLHMSSGRRTLNVSQYLLARHRIAVKLRDINKRMKSIAERAHQFGSVLETPEQRSSNHDPQWKNRLSESSLFFKDDDLVGIKRAQHELVGWLLDDEEPRRTVISVVGMGGSGKTTLVANTFNKQSVKQHFDFCAWITVSQQYAIEELFRSMAADIYKQRNEEVPMSVHTMRYKDLVETLVQYLQARRYLVVFDDVWNIQFWEEISVALPGGTLGSRVMLTTRNEDIKAPSQSGSLSYTHQIQPLREDDAWQLFCKRAFPNGGCPSYLDSLARNLVEKCEGLPLAIVALGGLMYAKKSTAEWKKVHDNLNWELGNNSALEVVKIISLLSYHDLSFQLKHCFLYCCIFPEDYAISRKRLIRLWMAEGFLEQTDDASPEVVAESYLMELIRRSLLQVTTRNSSGRPRMFKMHDILREFALSISKEEKFVAVSDGKLDGVEENGARRRSIDLKDEEMKLPVKCTSQLRSLFIFVVSSSSLQKLPSGLRFLRVLDLEDVPIDELPNEFGNLFNLRYLNLARTQVKVLPKSIGKLLNLQTLILKGAKIQELPLEIAKLHNLRHLTGFHYVYDDSNFKRYDSIRVPPNICGINSLQVLSFVEATDAFIKQLKLMTQLTSLGLANVMEADENDLCSAIGEMGQLHHLHLFAPWGLIKIDALSSAPLCLEKLFLNGEMEKVPHWFNTLHSLTKLTLQNSQLGEDLVSHIQALPNLSYLRLGDNAYNQERLCFIEGFQRLRLLDIFCCPLLSEVVMEKDVMPGLQHLEVYNCKQLRGFVPGVDHLTYLKHFYLYDVSDELIDLVCSEVNIDRSTSRGLLFTKNEEDDDEAESPWFYSRIY